MNPGFFTVFSTEWAPIIGAWLVLAGAVFVLIGAVGMLRFGDFFSRIHPAALKDSIGLPLLVVGVLCIYGWHLASLKLLLLLLFVWVTSAAASHALARSALAVRQQAETHEKARKARQAKTVTAKAAPVAAAPAKGPKATKKPRSAAKSPSKGKGK